MKTFSYQLSTEDIETLMCTLMIYQNFDFDDIDMDIDIDDIQQTINLSCCESAVEKLSTLQLDSLVPNELRMMDVSLNLADMILKQNIDVDKMTKQLCSKYVFSINKLLPVFDKIFDQFSCSQY